MARSRDPCGYHPWVWWSGTASIAYFDRHRHRPHYDQYLAAGHPIAAGVIEGACRHVIKTAWNAAACTGP